MLDKIKGLRLIGANFNQETTLDFFHLKKINILNLLLFLEEMELEKVLYLGPSVNYQVMRK